VTARGSRRPAGTLHVDPHVDLHVDLHVDDLVVPAGIGDEDAVRDAVESALREALQDRLCGDSPTTISLPDVRVRLDEPLATDPSGLSRQVAAEVTRVVLP
jgi:hypothetical protein